ncbi:MAG: hypothetical protein LUE63_00575, partial [Lachnospiraceae bacterium]|nr:hypothetical protein [Lachnospiraceae bacterium]
NGVSKSRYSCGVEIPRVYTINKEGFIMTTEEKLLELEKKVAALEAALEEEHKQVVENRARIEANMKQISANVERLDQQKAKIAQNAENIETHRNSLADILNKMTNTAAESHEAEIKAYLDPTKID